MSYLEYNNHDNSILVCKGDAKSKIKIIEFSKSENYSEYRLDGGFNGLRINNFLSILEQEGLKGETCFKELLELNSIPFLYVGQGPFGIERSGILIDKTKSKRPDFLVNIKDMGTILFDVKCRNKISFHNSEEKYFSLFVSEIEALHNLQKSILMPVWLAFTDRNTINDNVKPSFSFISISTIHQFWSGLFDFFKTEGEFQEIKVLRIPNSLFTKINEKIVFEVGFLNIDDDLLNESAKKYYGFNRIVKDKIKEVIRTKKCFKSNVFEELKSLNIDYCFPYEVSNFMETMIEQNIIDYQPKKHLKLIGE
jgi:hypothetical protein